MPFNLPNTVFLSCEISGMKLKVCDSSLRSKFETQSKRTQSCQGLLGLCLVGIQAASRSPETMSEGRQQWVDNVTNQGLLFLLLLIGILRRGLETKQETGRWETEGRRHCSASQQMWNKSPDAWFQEESSLWWLTEQALLKTAQFRES